MNVGHDMLQYFLKKEDTLSKRLVIHFSKKKKKNYILNYILNIPP